MRRDARAMPCNFCGAADKVMMLAMVVMVGHRDDSWATGAVQAYNADHRSISHFTDT